MVPRSEVNVLVEEERDEEDEERRWRERLARGRELFVVCRSEESFITAMLARSIAGYLYRDLSGLLR